MTRLRNHQLMWTTPHSQRPENDTAVRHRRLQARGCWQASSLRQQLCDFTQDPANTALESSVQEDCTQDLIKLNT